MQVSFSIIIICYDKNDLIMKHKVSQSKYLETSTIIVSTNNIISKAIISNIR